MYYFSKNILFDMIIMAVEEFYICDIYIATYI